MRQSCRGGCHLNTPMIRRRGSLFCICMHELLVFCPVIAVFIRLSHCFFSFLQRNMFDVSDKFKSCCKFYISQVSLILSSAVMLYTKFIYSYNVQVTKGLTVLFQRF